MEHGTDMYTGSPNFYAFPTMPSASFSSSLISFSCAVQFHSSFILLIFGHFLLLCHIFLPYYHCASHYICAWWRTRLTCHAGERSTAFSDQWGWLAHYYGNSSSSADTVWELDSVLIVKTVKRRCTAEGIKPYTALPQVWLKSVLELSRGVSFLPSGSWSVSTVPNIASHVRGDF